jgi:flagellar P-ring protein FlgI
MLVSCSQHLTLRLLLAITALFLATGAARATTVIDLTRMKGEGELVLRGLGLVTGLQGTGDTGKELMLARPLASLLANEGNAPATLAELATTKAVAVVMVTAVVRTGTKTDDQIDVTVTTIGSAKSLAGGELFLTPLRGPTNMNAVVWAIAAGKIELESPDTPTRARVTRGARMNADVAAPAITDSFDLILDEAFKGFQAASHIAEAIDAAVQPQGPKITTVIDDRTVRVIIPSHERRDVASFLAAVQSADVNPGFLGLGAKVVYNVARGIIVVTSDVDISPVAITQKDLSITTTTPAPAGTPAAPDTTPSRWAGVKTVARPSQTAKLTDLVAALKQLNVPVQEQIAVIRTLHRSGALHAEIVEDHR